MVNSFTAISKATTMRKSQQKEKKKTNNKKTHSKTKIEDQYERVFHKHNQNIQIDVIMEDKGNKTRKKI